MAFVPRGGPPPKMDEEGPAKEGGDDLPMRAKVRAMRAMEAAREAGDFVGMARAFKQAYDACKEAEEGGNPGNPGPKPNPGPEEIDY